jgi:hypothetical protein
VPSVRNRMSMQLSKWMTDVINDCGCTRYFDSASSTVPRQLVALSDLTSIAQL